MRIVFAGTPEFARVSLLALIKAGHDCVAVMTQPDRPSGRGRQMLESPVKREASRLGLLVMQPTSLKANHPESGPALDLLRQLAPDVMVVVAYGLLIPATALAIPRLGCINIHASLLPRWRGAAPIQRALAAGDHETGIALMQMEEGLDTGPVWAEYRCPIGPSDNFQSLHDRLADMGARGIVDLFAEFPPLGRRPRPQAEDGVTYAHKITKADLEIDWSKPALAVRDQIRAYDPAPGATARLTGVLVKCFEPGLWPQALKNPAPGQIIKIDQECLVVACGDGAITIGAAQRPGGRRLKMREFLNGWPVKEGQSFNLTE
ncbi:MAG: methionyl-tRNA formyltransferase [Betaproteobacteria bacterium]|nr:methionyl-tRNA formyltransferase [Betaproteobacteria bacterium]